MDDVDSDDCIKKVDREIKRERFISVFIMVCIVAYTYWDSYHGKHDWQDFYWSIVGCLGFIFYRLYQLDKKLDLILEKIYDLNH